MKHLLAKATLFTAALMGYEALAEADPQHLRVLNWSDYFAPTTISAFEAETGIKVDLETFDSSEVLTAKMLSGQLNYDLIFPSNDTLTSAIKLGVLQPLQRKSLTNWGNLDARLLKQLGSSDPENRYATPYLWGTTGIGVNHTRVRELLGNDAPVNSLALIFDPQYAQKLAQCGISLLDSPTEVLPMVLTYLGYDRNTGSAADYADVEATLQQVRPYIKAFESEPSSYMASLVQGESCVVLGYSGDLISAAEEAQAAGVDVHYAIPSEGGELWMDIMAIPTTASNVENAHRFIDYILRPDVIADITNYLAYPNANSAADSFVDPQIFENKMIYPDEQQLERLNLLSSRPMTVQRTMTRTWTNFKSAVLPDQGS